ncbi:MAG: molecular chaperone TorD family protein [Proteobacteria bacterium]|nr:molecular chaperone TorD family protein [Pseudomonadota bacterium]MBU1582333.1 molecular chaperone TorD family protein [Pseudomonadota bacterium]MBU2631030.1 molecular chaperone TorD family protein [Pseudomonadota bacterium]
MNFHQIIDSETARQGIYRIFSDCYHLPDKSMPEKLEKLEKQLVRLNSKADSHVSQMQVELASMDDYDSLKIDFSRLLIGPYSLPAPPYGSVYLEKERKVMGDSTLDVEARYEQFGLGLSKDFKNVPDHIAAELEFMFFLIYKEIDSIQSDDPLQAVDFLLGQESFLQDHLNMWVPDFANCIIEHSGTDFYRHLVQATQLFIAEDLEYLNQNNLSVIQTKKAHDAAI